MCLTRWAAEFSTQRMPWAAVTAEGEQHGFLPGERNVEGVVTGDLVGEGV